jgi:hypothetical protein
VVLGAEGLEGFEGLAGEDGGVELGLARAAALGAGFAALGFAGFGGGAVGFGSVDFGLGGAFVWHGLSPTFIILVCQLNIDLFLIVLLKMKEIYFCEWCERQSGTDKTWRERTSRPEKRMLAVRWR